MQKFTIQKQWLGKTRLNSLITNDAVSSLNEKCLITNDTYGIQRSLQNKEGVCSLDIPTAIYKLMLPQKEISANIVFLHNIE